MERLNVSEKAVKLVERGKEGFAKIGRYVGAFQVAPSPAQVQGILLLVGVGLLVAGLSMDSSAQAVQARYNDVRISQAVNVILMHLEGSFGALVMVAAGIGAIMSSAFGQYKAALALMVVSVGAFILRSLVGTFFNDRNISTTGQLT